MRANRLPLILAFAVFPTCYASAQTAPWPTDPPRPSAQTAPWPAAGGAPASPGTAPMMSPAPMAMPAPGGFGGASPPQGGPFAGGGGGGVPPCVAEFTKLREDVEKKGKVAKVASEHKANREEMCKHITAYAAAELKWAKFTEASVSSCGIPPQIVQQLKQVHTHTEETREKICNAAAAPGIAAAPSLSDALGTTRLPTPETTKTGSGTLDTLTGNAIQR